MNNDLVKLKPIQRPEWLGDIPERCCLAGASLEHICRNLLNEADTKGRVFPASLKIPISTEVEKFAEFRLMAVLGTSDFQPVWDEEAYFKRDLSFLGEQSNFNHALPAQPASEMERSGAVGKCLLLTFELWPVPHGFWHNDYFMAGISVPWTSISGGQSRLFCKERHIRFVSNGAEIGAWAVWHDHWTPVHPKDSRGRCGMITTMRRADIDRVASEFGLKLGWFAELNVWKSERDYEKLERSRKLEFFFD